MTGVQWIWFLKTENGSQLLNSLPEPCCIRSFQKKSCAGASVPVCFSSRCQLCEGGLQDIEEALRVNNGPIGVFDSGLGGLSVLQELKKVIPGEDYIFFGDSKNAPYGVRSDEEVYDLSLHVFDELMERGAKAVVVACNTATSVAVRRLRAERPDVPIVGMEPAVKPAVEENPGGRVVVMATPVTLRREKFAQLAGRFNDQAEIISLSSPEIVRYVENGRLHDEGLRGYIRGLFDSLGEGRSPDAVVLGCTHFPFVADLIREAAGSGVRLYDGNHGTAEELLRRLKERDLLAEKKKSHSVEILNSAGKEQVELSWKLFRYRIPE